MCTNSIAALAKKDEVRIGSLALISVTELRSTTMKRISYILSKSTQV